MKKKSLRKTKKKKRAVPLRKKINKILVPLDGSRNSFRALDFAISISKSLKSKITTVSIIDLPPILEYGIIDPVSKRLDIHQRKVIQRAKNKVVKNRIKFESKIIHGKTGNSIINFAKKGNFDIIIMGARGVGGFSGLLVGSVSNHVIQKSKKPVLIIK